MLTSFFKFRIQLLAMRLPPKDNNYLIMHLLFMPLGVNYIVIRFISRKLVCIGIGIDYKDVYLTSFTLLRTLSFSLFAYEKKVTGSDPKVSISSSGGIGSLIWADSPKILILPHSALEDLLTHNNWGGGGQQVVEESCFTTFLLLAMLWIQLLYLFNIWNSEFISSTAAVDNQCGKNSPVSLRLFFWLFFVNISDSWLFLKKISQIFAYLISNLLCIYFELYP